MRLAGRLAEIEKILNDATTPADADSVQKRDRDGAQARISKRMTSVNQFRAALKQFDPESDSLLVSTMVANWMAPTADDDTRDHTIVNAYFIDGSRYLLGNPLERRLRIEEAAANKERPAINEDIPDTEAFTDKFEPQSAREIDWWFNDLSDEDITATDSEESIADISSSEDDEIFESFVNKVSEKEPNIKKPRRTH